VDQIVGFPDHNAVAAAAAGARGNAPDAVPGVHRVGLYPGAHGKAIQRFFPMQRIVSANPAHGKETLDGFTVGAWVKASSVSFPCSGLSVRIQLFPLPDFITWPRIESDV